MPAGLACAAAASSPGLRPAGDLAVAASGLAVAVVVGIAAGRSGRHRTGWRLLAAAPLFPALGVALSALLTPAGPLDAVTVRWAPTLPGYLLAIAGMLVLVGSPRLRAAGVRLAVEAALFCTACLVVVRFVMLWPVGTWSQIPLPEQALLVAAVVVTSATMATALTVLGVVDPRRQPMALAMLASSSSFTAGCGLETAAILGGLAPAGDAGRFFACAGLWLLALAAVLDPGRREDTDQGPALARATDLGQLLPHLSMFAAMAVVGGVAFSGTRPGSMPTVGLVTCAVLAVVHRWITVRESRTMAAQLGRREGYFRSLVRSASDAVVILDGRLQITAATAALERVLGPAAAALVGRPLLEVVHPDDRPRLAAVLGGAAGADAAAAEPATGLFVLRLRDDADVWRWFEAGITDLRSDPDVGGVVLHCRDMTERHAREQALLGVAYTDPMTGLPNRAGFLSALGEELDRTTHGGTATLLMIELDGLPAAREHLGRDAVTLVVAEVGRRLRAAVRAEDTVARMGGGAFAVLAHGLPEEADRLASRCLSVVEQPVVTADGIVDLTAGIGLAAVEPGSVEALLHRAELAVRAAQAAGPGTARRFDAALGEAADRRERLRAALHEACAEQQLQLVFQPIMALEQQRITGLEAQLRWRHPELGEVPPAEFLPLAERAGLIGQLMRWALREATTVAAALPARNGEPLRVGVAVPTGYAATGTLVPDVEEALRASGLLSERLVLRVSSATVAAGDERTGLDVSTLRLMGVHVALAGFGSGDSALSHLTRHPIDIVTLDRSLISRIDRDRRARALCESVIGIGRALGLDVVAEGVDTPAQLAALAAAGCSFVQGFHVARPVTVAGLVAIAADEAAAWPGLVGSR